MGVDMPLCRSSRDVGRSDAEPRLGGIAVWGGGGVVIGKELSREAPPEDTPSLAEGASSTTRKLTSRASSPVHAVALDDASCGDKPWSVFWMRAVASSSRPARVRRVASAIPAAILLWISIVPTSSA